VSFCTAVNCMDGRVQLPVIHYLQERFGVLYVDVVTEAGPVRLLAGPVGSEVERSILRRVRVSIDAHDSSLIAVVAHADCAGNPTDDEEQWQQIRAAAGYLAENFPDIPVLGLWVDDHWSVSQICALGPAVGASESG